MGKVLRMWVKTEYEGARQSEFTSQLLIGVVWERQLPALGRLCAYGKSPSVLLG